MLIQEDNLSIRQLKDGDQQFLLKWLTNPKVLKYYEGRDRSFSLKKIEEKFFQREDEETRCLIQYNELPIGYLQFYPVDAKERKVYGYKDYAEEMYGMDQFIGDLDYWNKGLGTRLVKLVSNYILSEKGAERVVMDPQTWNERAIRCYEKCGFKKVKLLPNRELHEGKYRDCWLMEYRGKGK